MSRKPIKNRKELVGLVIDAINAALPGAYATPPVIELHIRDGLGRNWDIQRPAPSIAHRKAIDSVRDLFDLEPD